MPRTVALEDVELDLLVCSLEHWKQRLVEVETNIAAPAHVCARRFTVRRIEALLLKLNTDGVPGRVEGKAE